MLLLNTLEAILKLGLPMLGLSWLLFHWLYAEGELDRGDDRKAVRQRLRKMKKAFRGSANRGPRIVYDRWAWFGTGFYGLAALWTFLVLEGTGAAGFLSSAGFMTMLDNGIVAFIIGFLVNQLANTIEALLWFGYWSGDNGSVVVSIAVAYMGYWAGTELARRERRPADLLGRFRSRTHVNSGEESENEQQ